MTPDQGIDSTLFTTVVEENHRPVFNLCYRMLGSAEDAEDAAQETFWKAYRNYHRYDPTRPLLTWLLAIAAHHCIDEIRKRRMKTISLDAFTEEILPDSQPLPEHQTELRMENEILHALLDTLQPEDRAAVVMRYWYGFSDEEISQTLNLTVPAVKSRLFRARKQLATVIKQQETNHSAEIRRQNEPQSI
jgi:RNA polymerase sigma-70 factor (ECF subfamily)